MIDTLLPMGPTARPKGMPVAGAVRRLAEGANRKLFWTMMVLIGLAPLPVGSNRPLFWALSAVAIGVILLVWALVNRRHRVAPAVTLQDVGVQGWLFGFYMLFLVFQILPIAPWLGGIANAGLEELGVVPHSISLAPGDTLLMALRHLVYAAFFFLMLQVAISDSQRRSSLDILLVIITTYAAIGLASLRMGDTILGFEKWAYLGSATGTFVNRNSFATFLAFGAVLAITQLMDLLNQWVERRRGDWELRHAGPGIVLYSSALLLILAAVVSSQSRMGFVVTLCGMLAVMTLAVLRNRRLLRGVLAVVAMGAIAVIGVLLVYGDGLIGRLDVLEKSSSVRLAFYRQVLELIWMRPWAGFGGGAFELAFPLVHELPVSGDVVWDKAHSSYLALWSELGLFAGTVPLILLALMSLAILRSLLERQGSWRAQTAAVGVMVVGAVHSSVDFSLEIQANTMMFLAIIALGFAAKLKSSKFSADASSVRRQVLI